MTQLLPHATNTTIKGIVLLSLALSLTACTSDDARPSDSQGASAVDVVENHEAGWKAGREWSAAAQPTLEIGSEERGYQFAGIRGASRLSDGRIVVGDAGTSEVRLYDGQGRFVSAAGRSGGGPEEFRAMGRLVAAAGDSVVAFDAATRRISVLGPSGAFARSLTPEAATLGASLAGVLENGSFVVGIPRPLPPRDGLSRDSVVYLLISPDGSTADTLGVAPGGQQYQRIDGSRVTRLTVPFGPMPAASASGNRIFIGATDRYEIREFGPDGAATRVIRRQVEPQAFTEAHFRAVADQFPQMATALAEIPRPSQAPVFAALLVDRENNLWVQDYPSPGATSISWTVFDPQGRMLGQVSLPSNFRPTDIGADYILGVWTDELGVERVRMYPLRKP
ncbi:MAG TPA: hypothetical protein VF414_01930 [Thermoanaerobaculia bacterium]